MAVLENKNINPMAAAIANFCCLMILGYLLLGQARKGVFPLFTLIGLLIIDGILSRIIGPLILFAAPLCLLLAIFVAIDAYQVAEAVQNGEQVDENEYKFEILYKLMRMIDKQAIYNGPQPPV